MNHNISHCKGKGCPIREDCRRFLAFLDIKWNPKFDEQHKGVIVDYVTEQYDPAADKCPHYFKAGM